MIYERGLLFIQIKIIGFIMLIRIKKVGIKIYLF